MSAKTLSRRYETMLLLEKVLRFSIKSRSFCGKRVIQRSGKVGQ